MPWQTPKKVSSRAMRLVFWSSMISCLLPARRGFFPRVVPRGEHDACQIGGSVIFQGLGGCGAGAGWRSCALPAKDWDGCWEKVPTLLKRTYPLPSGERQGEGGRSVQRGSAPGPAGQRGGRGLEKSPTAGEPNTPPPQGGEAGWGGAKRPASVGVCAYP